MSRLPRREGTIDRIRDGVAVVLVEEGGETAGEVHVAEERLPDGIDEGDKVSMTHETYDDATPKDAFVVVIGAAAVFAGSVTLTTASPSLPADPFLELPSEPASVTVNALVGVFLMAVGVRAALPSFERLLRLWTEPEPEGLYRFSVERLDDDTDEARRRVAEKTEYLRTKRGEESEFETDGGNVR